MLYMPQKVTKATELKHSSRSQNQRVSPPPIPPQPNFHRNPNRPRRERLTISLLHPQGHITQEWQFEETCDRITIGRSSQCDLRLLSIIVSRRHALLQRTARGWMLQNLSPNGCYVDDYPLVGPKAIAPSLVVRLAKNGPRLRFTLTLAEADTGSEATAPPRRRPSSLTEEELTAARETWLAPEPETLPPSAIESRESHQ